MNYKADKSIWLVVYVLQFYQAYNDLLHKIMYSCLFMFKIKILNMNLKNTERTTHSSLVGFRRIKVFEWLTYLN